MVTENLTSIPLEKGDDKYKKLREEVRYLKNEAHAKHKQELESGTPIKDGFDRHLLKLTDEDIENIPKEQLEFWEKLKNINNVNMDADLNNLRDEIDSLFPDVKMSGIMPILLHKLTELVVKSLPKIKEEAA